MGINIDLPPKMILIILTDVAFFDLSLPLLNVHFVSHALLTFFTFLPSL